MVTFSFTILYLVPDIINMRRLHAPFFSGLEWHNTNQVVVITRAVLQEDTFILFVYYSKKWSATLQGFVIFALLGMSEDARATCHKLFGRFATLIGWKSRESDSQEIAFRDRSTTGTDEERFGYLCMCG
jgi:hypothetical protein